METPRSPSEAVAAADATEVEPEQQRLTREQWEEFETALSIVVGLMPLVEAFYVEQAAALRARPVMAPTVQPSP